MDAGQREYLEKRHAVSEWHGRDTRRQRVITGFGFRGSELSGWTLLRSRRDEHGTPAALRTLWSRDDPNVELIAIDMWECVSVAAAHDQLLEVLGGVQSDAVERHKGRDGIGDVQFTLGQTMALFVRVNVVVLLRNAGPKTVDVQPVARVIDEMLVRLSGTSTSPRRR